MKPITSVAALVLVGLGTYGILAYQGWQSRYHADAQMPTLVAQASPVAATPSANAPGFTMVAQNATPAPSDAETNLSAPTEPGNTTTTPSPTAPATTPSAPAVEVDESALRYFAQQGDTARLQREIERLRALHPGWQPPADPLADDYVPDADITAMWDLFSKGDFAGVRAAIAAKQAKDPGFVPSADLLDSLSLGEAGLQLRQASDAGNSAEVITIAANNGRLLVCESVDNLWRLAEAFVDTGTPDRAVDAYRYILTSCTNPEERFATMQKAIALLDRTTIEPLLALEKTDAAGSGEFASLRLDLARTAIAAALEQGGQMPVASDIDLFEKNVAATNAPEDLRLLGYFELNRNRPNEARRLFQKALDVDPGAESAEALGVALLQVRDFAAAESVLADYRDDNDTIGPLYLNAAAALLSGEPRKVLDQAVLGRIADAAMSALSANTAQELGWYAYAFSQPQTALEWFTLALRWQPDLEPAAYGMVVVADALGDSATVKSIQTQWVGRSVRIANFGKTSDAAATPQTPVASGVRNAPASPPADPSPGGGGGGGGSSSSCTGYVPAASLSAGAALSRAWCMMRSNRPAQAVDLFARALQSPSQGTRSDAAYGQALAYVRMGLASEASVAAAAAPLTSKQIIELDISILTLRATSAYSIGDYVRALDALDQRARYAAERNDLLTLRAWSYYHLRRYREALQIFTAVAATGYGDAASGLDATKRALNLFN